ncbi:DUF3592 domain-containing protein [Legionella israelensis]|uniref:DUF3592 domain-containing protein n=1 Tax=Legionella israelensis TaxID=454 RepID=A0A0W0WJU4_9GAMM|nr:DUF3592 domain-containing protein [Legionella israelensis]KTD32594.1 hypothetical protein Lisr_0404 [Legionella israelensis]QBR85235.1 DUF3592 domain-containing protein [Legionella israelensis]QBS09861.1 DUF3592 domain-containing protein [Legionella israelensis]QDP71340.1 DUF3592 domain-containing protein [Legionella israelensis]SCY17943.1 Protein of unknown function [Legionella israelensis DSM 19235]
MLKWLTSWQGLLDLSWLLFLLLILRYFWKDRQALLQTRNWLKTKGKVTRCEWTRQEHRVWPEIEYLYEVNEQEFIGQYLFLDTSHNDPNSAYARGIAYKAAMSYEKNQEIDVYYDPFHPQRSALDIRIPRKLNVVIALIIGFIVLHLCVIAYQILFLFASD